MIHIPRGWVHQTEPCTAVDDEGYDSQHLDNFGDGRIDTDDVHERSIHWTLTMSTQETSFATLLLHVLHQQLLMLGEVDTKWEARRSAVETMSSQNNELGDLMRQNLPLAVAVYRDTRAIEKLAARLGAAMAWNSSLASWIEADVREYMPISKMRAH
eukprot:SAG31_NODE_367_length_16811_cov_20.811584_15_plen_157_part_00